MCSKGRQSVSFIRWTGRTPTVNCVIILWTILWIHCEQKKRQAFHFGNNSIKNWPISIIIGTEIPEDICNLMAVMFPNSRHVNSDSTLPRETWKLHFVPWEFQ